ncbi:MAG: CHASE2 domain-containing protein [Marinobacter sp.]|nr:CHASE2 domain-containing protein [Marinobacter sp.]MBC7192347.1 CHASE2 domain-containing protein [Marinobacter sp.]
MNRDRMPIKNTPWTLGLLLLSALVLLPLSSLPQRLDYWIYDSIITRPAASTPAAASAVIVAIDEPSLEQLGRWPWPRSTHARLIRRLNLAGAETIVFDILFPEPSSGDADLASAMRAHGNVVLPVHLSPPSRARLMETHLPAPALASAASSLGHAHIELDEDGLARGLYLFNGLARRVWPALAVAATGQSMPLQSDSTAPYVNVRTRYAAVPLAGGAGTLPTYSYADILNSPPATGAFRGKTVFVGATAAGFGDILPTPFSRLSTPLSGVEFHANSYNALVSGELIYKTDRLWSYGLAVSTALLLAILLPKMRPTRTLAICLSMIAVLLSLQAGLIVWGERWLPVSLAVLMPALAFPFTSASRLAMANRFLNRQLNELAQGQQLSLPATNRRSPTQLLDHLRTLLRPSQWWLSANNEMISASGLTRQDIPDDLPAYEWKHIGNQSWIKLMRGQIHYRLGLTLTHDLSLEAVHRYLQRLPLLPDTLPGIGPRTSGEHVSARITQVKRASRRMYRLQQFTQRSFERMPDGIIVTDELGVIRFANSHIERWFNEPAPSLNGMPLTRLLEGHDPRETLPWHETLADTLTLSQSRTVDLRVRDKDFLVHLAPFDLPDTPQSGIIANISDISELRERQRQHREAIDFISHDVRSPLVSQMALIEQLKRNPERVAPEQLEQLGRLARRSYNLAEEFVQLARAEQLTETRFYECEFLAIVENARDSVSEQAAEKHIHLSLHGTEDLWLMGNAELLERAVINLLTNAVQYSDPHSTVNIVVFAAGHQACLTVSDEGRGITPDELPYLFDRFQRQKSSEISGNFGAGLGLSFVNVVVEKHRGEITVNSTPGEGTSFTIRLPTAHPL